MSSWKSSWMSSWVLRWMSSWWHFAMFRNVWVQENNSPVWLGSLTRVKELLPNLTILNCSTTRKNMVLCALPLSAFFGSFGSLAVYLFPKLHPDNLNFSFWSLDQPFRIYVFQVTACVFMQHTQNICGNCVWVINCILANLVIFSLVSRPAM